MSTKPELPPLPEPFDKTSRLFADGQMDEHYLLGYRKGIEDAAKACEAQGRASANSDGMTFYTATGQCAAAIRALVEPKGD